MSQPAVPAAQLEPVLQPRWGYAPIRWAIVVFFAVAHGLAVWGVVHLTMNFSWATLSFGVAWYLLCGLSITAGYHRLFSHQSYKASAAIRTLYLLFGAASCQNSALEWSQDHRRHHRRTDEVEDPYSTKHGFLWAHIGWIWHDVPETTPVVKTEDLERDPIVRFQHRYWLLLAVVFGGVLPACIAGLWGDALGGLLVAGFLRLVLAWHSTFSVNSFAHKFGKRTYAADASARDSYWVALISLGEGYHSFHHRFQSDYRNGVRWYQFDPSKWLIWTLSRVGLTRQLVRIPAHTRKAALSAARARS
ncbi:MAG: fatty acid desaturase [Planctomycetes bacterium]|nr:fatty acid desaturase [Planctomycetota bacterium]